MGNCDDLSSSPNRAGYVSWSVDSGESRRPSTRPPPGTGEKGAFSNQSLEPTSSGCVPSLVRSTQEPSGEETNMEFDLPYPRKQLTRRKCTKISKNSRQIPGNSKLRDHDRSSKLPQDAMANKEEPCKDENVPLHRSSPVISRRSKLISSQKKATSPSNSLSMDSSPCSPSSCDQRECVTSTGKEDVETRLTSCHQSFETTVEDKKPRVSLSSSPISILRSQDRSNRSPQRSEKEHRGWSLNSWSTPKRTGHSSSTPHSKDRSCSELLDLPPDIFKAGCELEKENAHFVVVDMTLEVLEGVKWTLSFDSMTYKHCASCAKSQPSSEGRDPARAHGSDGSGGLNRRLLRCDARPDWGADTREPQAGHSEHQTKSLSILSTDSGFEDCGVGTMPPDLVRNAECLAQQLVLEFKRKWLPSHVHRRGRQSLRTSLQELPGTGGVEVKTGSLTEEIRLRTRMRGSLSWAPPSFQIIFSVQPPHRRSEVVASQHYLCAGCGTEVEPRYIKKLWHCEYLGRYFCDCCHSGSEAVIPGRVLSNWDFSRQLHTPTNVFILSLAVSDFLVGLLLMPLEMFRNTTCWLLGDVACVLYTYLITHVVSASVGNIVIISADRYVAICDPLHYPARITLARAKCCVCLCWLLYGFYSVFYLKDELVDLGGANSCVGQCAIVASAAMGTVDLILNFVFPVTVIVALYARVFVVAVSQARAMRSNVAGVTLRLSVGLRSRKSELKAARTLGVVVFVYLMCYCPFYGYVLVVVNLPNLPSVPFLFFLFYFNSCLNPLIYALFYSWFRKAIRLIVTLQILQPGSYQANVLQ